MKRKVFLANTFQRLSLEGTALSIKLIKINECDISVHTLNKS